MAKSYAFKFSAIPARFEGGFVSMNLSLMIAPPSETRECTLAEAVAYLQ